MNISKNTDGDILILSVEGKVDAPQDQFDICIQMSNKCARIFSGNWHFVPKIRRGKRFNQHFLNNFLFLCIYTNVVLKRQSPQVFFIFFCFL